MKEQDSKYKSHIREYDNFKEKFNAILVTEKEKYKILEKTLEDCKNAFFEEKNSLHIEIKRQAMEIEQKNSVIIKLQKEIKEIKEKLEKKQKILYWRDFKNCGFQGV